MNDFLKLFTFLALLVRIFFITGCSDPQQALKQPPGTIQKQKQSEANHDRALVHFIEGTALDAKEQYAEAILEYQQALRYEANGAIYYALSRDYAIRGNYESAVEEGRNAVLLDSTNISYRENLANIYFSGSQTDSAVREYEKIIALDSSRTETWFTLASLYQLTQPLKALEIYEKLLLKSDDRPEILFQCSQILRSLGRFDEASKKYLQILESEPNNRQIQKQLADTYLKMGRLEQAQSVLERLISTDSSDMEAAAALADIYLSQKQFQKSVDLFQSLWDQGLNNPEVKLRIGIGFFGLTEHDSTLAPKTQDIFEELKKENPGDWRPYWYLGAVALNRHHDSVAGVYFKKVTELEKNNTDAWWYYCSSLFEQSKYDSLLGIIEQPEQMFPGDFRFFMLHGLVFTRLEKQEKAVVLLRKALEINPKDVNTLGTLALTLDGMQRYEESDRLYEEGLRLDPKSAILLNNYSYSLAERGLQLERSIEMSKQAVAAEPENAAYLDTYGWIFYKLGDYNNALIYTEKSIFTGKASDVVHEHLGDIYDKLGQKSKALEFWKKALEMDPKNKTVKEKILQGKM